MSTRPDYVWPSAREAEAALLLHLRNPTAEKLIIRLMPLAALAGGLPGYAPAVVEIVESGEAIAVLTPGRVLSQQGEISAVSWRKVRELWEAPAREREQHIFEKLSVDKRAAAKVIAQRISTQTVARVTHFAAPPGGPFSQQLHAAGWWKRLVAAHTLGYAAALTA